MLKEVITGSRKEDDKEENCPICQCELFEDDLMAKSQTEIA
jgi:hypothetical protein